ncbi:ABC transporter substrate-binding protein [Aureimonas mangrovi]|uniref:ABC transporter substrate-binding protein n=1 Tax=Aureimonas mangrovi TaxID=2758041 RepID=UPI00163DB7B7|nr:ABC transporter substrate-binding protein [Aureimonas mangrovi]
MRIRSMMAAVSMAALCSSPAMAQDAPASVKAGVLNDMSGTYADVTGQGAVVAAQLAIDDFKASEAGANVDVELVSADHQNKPDVAATTARSWYEAEGVDVILDLPASSTALAVADVTRQMDKVVIVSGGGTSDLTGTNCSPNTIHWTYDTWSLAHGTGSALVREGLTSWFFLTADYAFGHALERDTSQSVEEAGGTVVGSVRHPFPTQDFSSFLLQAQASGAQVIGLANAGADTTNAIKQAAEFGIVQSGQALAGLLMFISDIHSLGLQTAQGLVLTEAFYWDLNDGTREWSQRFAERFDGRMPTSSQAGVYSGLLHYLKAVAEVGSPDDAAAVIAQMKATQSEDPLFTSGMIREDGRKLHDMYLFRVKTPEQSEGPWDYYELVSTIPGDEAFRPMEGSGCDLSNW